MRRFLLAAVMCGAVTGAQAADMPDLPFLRGSVTEGLSSAAVNWQGVYVGGQVSYGSVTSKIAPGANSDMLAQSDIPSAGRRRSTIGMSLPERAIDSAHRLRRLLRIQLAMGRRRPRRRGNYIHDGFRSIASSVGVVRNGPTVSIDSITHSNAVVKLSRLRFVAHPRRLRRWDASCLTCLPAARFGNQTVDRTVSAIACIRIRCRRHRPPASKTKLVYGYSVGAGVDVMLVAGLFMRAEYEYRRVTSEVEYQHQHRARSASATSSDPRHGAAMRRR